MRYIEKESFLEVIKANLLKKKLQLLFNHYTQVYKVYEIL